MRHDTYYERKKTPSHCEDGQSHKPRMKHTNRHDKHHQLFERAIRNGQFDVDAYDVD